MLSLDTELQIPTNHIIEPVVNSVGFLLRTY